MSEVFLHIVIGSLHSSFYLEVLSLFQSLCCLIMLFPPLVLFYSPTDTGLLRLVLILIFRPLSAQGPPGTCSDCLYGRSVHDQVVKKVVKMSDCCFCFCIIRSFVGRAQAIHHAWINFLIQTLNCSERSIYSTHICVTPAVTFPPLSLFFLLRLSPCWSCAV